MLILNVIDSSQTVNNNYVGSFNDITTSTIFSVETLDQKKSMANNESEFRFPYLDNVVGQENDVEMGNTELKSGDTIQGDKIEINNNAVGCTNNYSGFINSINEENKLLKSLINEKDELIASLRETIEILKNRGNDQK